MQLRWLTGDELLYVWFGLFIATALITGIVSGFFKSRKIQSKGLDWKILRHEAIFIVLSLTLASFVIGALITVLKDAGWITFKTGPASWWVILLEYAGYFLFFDTCFYWAHRAMHIEPYYRWIHKTHHKSVTPHPLSSLSMHPLESLIEGTFVPLFVTLFTIHETTMVLVTPTAVLMGLYVHSGFEFLPRWWNRSWLTKWFISATFHDQHHRHFVGNYGGYTTIWDYLCGTVRPQYERDFRNQRRSMVKVASDS